MNVEFAIGSLIARRQRQLGISEGGLRLGSPRRSRGGRKEKPRQSEAENHRTNNWAKTMTCNNGGAKTRL